MAVRFTRIWTWQVLLTIAATSGTELVPERFLRPRDFNHHPLTDVGVPALSRGPSELLDNHPYAALSQKRPREGRQFPQQDVVIYPSPHPSVVTPRPLESAETNEVGYEADPYVNVPKNYAFSYSVKDQHSGDDFSHSQAHNGKATRGQYRVKLPDGRVQVVSYTADHKGYRADVQYEDQGHAIQPQIQPQIQPDHGQGLLIHHHHEAVAQQQVVQQREEDNVLQQEQQQAVIEQQQQHERAPVQFPGVRPTFEPYQGGSPTPTYPAPTPEYPIPSPQPHYISPSHQPHYASPSPQPHYASPSPQLHYASPSSQPHYASPSSQPHYASPSPQPHYASPSPQPHYASPSPQPHYASPSPQPHYASPTPQPHYPSHSQPQHNYRFVPRYVDLPPTPSEEDYSQNSVAPSAEPLRFVLGPSTAAYDADYVRSKYAAVSTVRPEYQFAQSTQGYDGYEQEASTAASPAYEQVTAAPRVQQQQILVTPRSLFRAAQGEHDAPQKNRQPLLIRYVKK